MDTTSELVLGFVGRRSARLQHLLHEIEAHTSLGLVFRHGKVAEQVRVAQVTGAAVAVLVHQPLVLGDLRVARAYVLELQMLQLVVNIVPSVAHLRYNL